MTAPGADDDSIVRLAVDGDAAFSNRWLWQLLEGPGVAVGICEPRHSNPASEVGHCVDINVSIDQHLSSRLDVVDDKVETTDRARFSRQSGQSLPENNRAR